MANTKPPSHLVLLFFSSLLSTAFLLQGVVATEFLPHPPLKHVSSSSRKLRLQDVSSMGRTRNLIGSTAPTCTYNECRGCRFRCRAEQVPVNANDPMNSAYRYRCVCHK